MQRGAPHTVLRRNMAAAPLRGALAGHNRMLPADPVRGQYKELLYAALPVTRFTIT